MITQNKITFKMVRLYSVITFNIFWSIESPENKSTNDKYVQINMKCEVNNLNFCDIFSIERYI